MHGLTYLPHEAVVEVSKIKEPIGRKCGIRLVRKSITVLISDSTVLIFSWLDIQMICDSTVLKFHIHLVWDSSDLVAN